MKSAVIHEAADRTFVLVFDKGDEVVAELTAFAKREVLAGAHFTAIGAFSDATLGLTESKRTTGGSTSASRRKFSPCWAMWRSMETLQRSTRTLSSARRMAPPTAAT
jgi:Plants and Prokaryotes Conserved (PCC) domain